MKVILLSEDWHLQYEEYLLNNHSAMIYYSLKFKKFLKKQTDSSAQYYIAVDEHNNINGILPLMLKDGPLGIVINSLPFYGSNGGILSDSDDAKEVLLEKYLEIIRGNEIAAATLIENPLDKNYPYHKIQYDELDFRIGQLTDISGDFDSLEDIMLRFDSKTRNIIRKAVKSDVQIEIDNSQFEFLQKIHVDNMHSIGGLAKGPEFFENVQNIFEAGIDYNLFIAKKDDEIIAATLVFYFREVIEYYTPVIVKEYRSFQPLSLIIASAMLDGSRLGYKWWNWGGTWQTQGGVYDFKSKWGTIDLNYNYYTVVNNKQIYESSTEYLLKYYGGVFVIPFNKLKSYTKEM